MKCSASTRARSLRRKRRKKLRNYSTLSEGKSVSIARTSRRSDKQMDEYIRMRMFLSFSFVSTCSSSQGEAFGSAGGPNDSGHSENTLITVEALRTRFRNVSIVLLVAQRLLVVSLPLHLSLLPNVRRYWDRRSCLYHVLLQLACKLYVESTPSKFHALAFRSRINSPDNSKNT